ncbi:MAG: large repetitive protein [Solirubrobacterales bacterium]|jgi:subtilisin-like proprotein convertase family protein|nr:large repetitive protein [Solirubrobacterales bacterium]
MNGRKLGRTALMAAAVLTLGLVLAAPAAQARKKVITKSYEVGVGAPSGGVPIAIPDGGGAAQQLVRDPISVKGLNPRGKIKDVNVGVRITHPFASDLEIYLATPRGVFNMSHDVGGNGNNYGNGFAGCAGGLTTFDSQTPTSIASPGLQAPFVGFYAPQESLSWLDGLGGKKATNATWSLLVMDDNNQHGTGTLDCFKLTVRESNPK